MTGNPQTHPRKELLVAFGLGRIESDEAQEIENHLEICEECCETMLRLHDDTFVELVRNSPAPDEPTDGGDGSLQHAATILESANDSRESSELPAELRDHPRYRIVEAIGKGGMGDVFKAEHRLMNRTVALKLINRDLVRNEKAVERFRREVRAAAQLMHPNIVTAHDAEQAGDAHFLVMEFVDGTNLAEIVKRDGPLSVARACEYVRQTACGLQHAHEMGMVHRDIKPHNLMVAAGGRVKILDFGLATLAATVETAELQVVDSVTPPALHNLTQAGTTMGTPDYISPEQAGDARTADGRSDIYSLGCTFYFLLTGQPPFAEGSAAERIKAHAGRKPEPIENLRVDLPAEVADVVRRMMEKDPADRIQTPAEIADALAPFVDEHRTGDKSLSARDRSRGNWITWPRIAALVFGLFALASIIYVATDNGTLVIEANDPNARIVLRQDGETVRTIDVFEYAKAEGMKEPRSADRVSMKTDSKGRGWYLKSRSMAPKTIVKIHIDLRSGDYEVETAGDVKLVLNKGKVTIGRGGSDFLSVTKDPRNAAALAAAAEPQNSETDALLQTRQRFKEMLEEFVAIHQELGDLRPETRQRFAELLADTRSAKTDNDWKRVFDRSPSVLGKVEEDLKPEFVQLLNDLDLSSIPAAFPETRQALNALITDARSAKTDDNWKRVIARHASMLGELSEDMGRGIVQLLSDLPDEMHEKLLDRGYLKWRTEDLDSDRQDVIRKLLRGVLKLVPDAKELGEPSLLVADVGFMVVEVPETNRQIVAWYLLARDLPVPILLPFSKWSVKPEDELKILHRLGLDLEDKLYSDLPPALPEPD